MCGGGNLCSPEQEARFHQLIQEKRDRDLEEFGPMILLDIVLLLVGGPIASRAFGFLARVASRSGKAVSLGSRTAKQATALVDEVADAARALKATGARATTPNGGFLDPMSIRFSQDSIRPGFRSPEFGTIDDLVEGLRTGRVKSGDVEPIRLVEREGNLITIDNRRLQAFREAGLDVPTRMATPAEIEQAIRQGKFSAGPLGTDTIRIRGR